EPGFLESPEWPHGAADPGVEAAFFGHGGGELAEHERGGKAPEEGQDEEEQKRGAVASEADDVLDVVGASRDHEVGGGEQRQQTELARGAGLPAGRDAL